jgi:hypothetical protein
MEFSPPRLASLGLFLGTVVVSTLLSAALCQRAMSAPAPAPSSVVPGRPPEPRTISVQGQADLSTTPDEVTIVVRIDTFHASLKQAKQENDRRARLLLARLPALGVSPKNAQTDEFSISPRQEGPYEKRVLAGYDVSKRVTLTICDVSQADAVLDELFEGGANALERVSFAPSKIAETRAEVRLLAVKAAQQKAEGLARQLGQKLGHPLKVEDTTDLGSSASLRLSNASYSNESAPASGPTLAAGKSRVQASVAVLFELQDP